MEDFEFRWKLFTQSGQSFDEVELLEGVTFLDSQGRRYRNVHWNEKTKTLVYEMFHKTSDSKERWEGLFHGRLMKEFLNMKRVDK